MLPRRGGHLGRAKIIRSERVANENRTRRTTDIHAVSNSLPGHMLPSTSISIMPAPAPAPAPAPSPPPAPAPAPAPSPPPPPPPPPLPPPPPQSSAPTIGPQSNPVANTQVGCTLSSSSTEPTPTSYIGSEIGATTVNGNRLPLQVVGNEFDRDDCAHIITTIFKDRWDPEGHDWKSVTT